MKPIILLISMALLTANPLFAQDKPSEHIPTLVATALANNPELKSSQARWQMFVSKSRQAGALEDPMLMLKLQNMVNRAPLSFTSDSNTAKVIGITQQIPFWGKRDLREEVARYEADSYRWLIDERKLELERMVKETCYQLYSTDRALELLTRNIAIAGDFVTIAESRYSIGQGAQTDILKAGVDRSKMLDMQITLQQQRRTLAANLNFLLNRPADTAVGSIAPFELPQVTKSAEELRELAYQKRPQLKSMVSLVNKGSKAMALAKRESYPDFAVSFEYMQRQPAMGDPGYDMYSLALTFNLPLQKERRAAMVAESEAETSMAGAEIAALKNSIGFVINDTLAQLERRRKLVELYRGGILPQSEQALESALIGYRAGKVDFLTLLDSRVTLFNYQRELYESQVEYMMALARLEAAVGGELSNPAALPQAPAQQSVPPVGSEKTTAGHNEHH
ncbi:MAG: TolC family protein [Geobacter sp.]|nr:TolC family protein [Geobacter sp.]